MANKRDVQLVVRARDEASKAFELATAALESLLGVNDKVGASASRTGDRIAELAGGLVNFDRSVATILGTADRAASAFDKLGARLADQRAELSSVKSQAEGAARAIKQLQSQIVDARLSGGSVQGPRGQKIDTAELVERLRAAERQYDSLITTETRLTQSIASSEAALASQRSSLQQVGSIANAAEAARNGLAETIDRETAAMRRQADAAKVLQTVNRSTGVVRDRGDMDELVAQIQQQADAVERQNAAYREQAREIAKAEAAQRELNALLNSASGKSARDSASVFRDNGPTDFERGAAALEEQSIAARQADAAIASLRGDSEALVAIQKRLATQTDHLNKRLAAGEIDAKEYAAALKLLRADADRASAALGTNGIDSRGRPSLFGLKPYEMQNLSFQINDIFTQLASGTSITQTLAQQGGQLIQLFPRVGAAIAAGLTSAPILVVTAAVAALVLGIKEAADQASLLRQFQGYVAGSADAASLQAESLRDAANAIDRYGLSAEEAVKVVRAFLKEGLDPALLEDFGRTAKNMADVLGKDVADAAADMAKGLTGGYDAILKLNEATNFLTAAEAAHIRQLFEEGRAAEARTEAYEIFANKQDEAASKMRGSWSSAVRSLGQAWDSLMKALANSVVIDSVVKGLEIWGNRLDWLVRRIAGVRTLLEVTEDIADAHKQIGLLNQNIAANGDPFGLKQAKIDHYVKRLQQLNAEEKRLQEQREATPTDTINPDAALKQIERQERLAEIQAEREKARLDRLDGERRVSEAGRLAFEEEMRRSGDEQIAAAERKLAIEKETEKVQKAQAEAAKRRAREAEREAKERRRANIEAIQNNGRDEVVATARRFEGLNETANRGDLMAFFKQNGINVDPKMIAWCAAFVNAVLKTNGLPGTGSLAARSFLNFGSDATSNPQEGDIVVLRRGNNQAQGHVGFFQGFDDNGNVRVLGGNQRDGVNTKTFNKEDVLSIRRAPSVSDVAKEEQKLVEKRVEDQAKFNALVDAENVKRGQTIIHAQELRGLVGEELIEAEKRIFVEEAVAAQRARAAEQGVAYTAQQEATTRVLAATEFELTRAIEARAEAARKAAEDPVQGLQEQRDALQQQIDFLRDSGEFGLADSLLPELDAINAKLAESIQKAIEFWRAVMDGAMGGAAAFGMTNAQIEAMITRLETASLGTQRLGTFLGVSLGQIAQQVASGAASAFDRFAQSVAEGKDIISSLGSSFRQAAAEVLRAVAQMIIQQQIYNFVLMITKLLGGGTGGGGGGAGSTLSGVGKALASAGAGVHHKGGIAGSSGTPRRTVSPAWFAAAVRYHSGGIAGLKPGEVPAILQAGEEVLTRDDPRHVANGGGASKQDIKIINTIDAGEFVSQGLNTRVGEKAVLNFISANAGAVRGAIGG